MPCTMVPWNNQHLSGSSLQNPEQYLYESITMPIDSPSSIHVVNRVLMRSNSHNRSISPMQLNVRFLEATLVDLEKVP